MMRAGVVFLLLCFHNAWAQESQDLYDAYFGKPLENERQSFLDSINATSLCTIRVAPCKKHEGRRVDGTCANPRYPPRGGSPTPLLRMLPAKFGLGNSLRPATNGSELPSTRVIRTKILADGYPVDYRFTALASHVLVFSFVDIVDLTYLLRYMVVSDCCVGNTPNRANPTCIPIPVPGDDPYLRRTGIRCMNLTRFFTYQERGCIPITLPAERYVAPTPLQDLSTVYGYTNVQEAKVRAYRGGLLKSEFKGGVERPPGTALVCIKNRRPVENACYEFGDALGGNSISGVYLTAMWFYREHNRLARKLADINPCWQDQQLFETARAINIAQYQHILYYELLAELLGRGNAMKTGIIYDTRGYVNDFDERYKPGVYHEYLLGGRFFHNFQDGRSDLYSSKGKYLGSREQVEDSQRSGILEVNNTEADLTQGAFRQSSTKFDYVMDPDLAERVYGELQRASDLPAIDIKRSRDHGLPPYNHYRKLCGLPVAHDFEDFHDVMHYDKIEQLRRTYGDVDDVDLMAGLYSEKLIEGGFVGPTLFCIFVQNLLQWRKSDRHFFEHGDIPAALTLPQLNEIRKSSMARILCDNGISVDEIQPRAMLAARPGNEILSCKHIPSVDLTKWTDPHCHPEEHKEDKEQYAPQPYDGLWESYNYDKK